MATSRPYRSVHRRRQAEDTRRRILAAARKLFVEPGYAATSVADIAAEAEVSVPTLYASVGTKAELARRLVEFLNEEGRVHENDRLQRAATTPVDLLRANVHLVRDLYERVGEVILAVKAAAQSAPELVPVVTAGEGYHRDGEYAIAARLAEMGGLRAGVDAAHAGAVLTTLASPEVVGQLVKDHGWSFDRVEQWLLDTFTEQLLA
jgi:AcrR family transcriptional regulator